MREVSPGMEPRYPIIFDLMEGHAPGKAGIGQNETVVGRFVLKAKKITLALFLPRYEGGATSVIDPVFYLDKERFERIFIFLTRGGAEREGLGERGYKVFYLSQARVRNRFRLSVLFKLAGILKENHVDILHCHAHKATVYGTLAATLARTPIVLTQIHGLNRTRNIGRRTTNFIAFKKIKKLIAISRATRKDVIETNWKLPADKVCVLENSVDYQKFADAQVNQAEMRAELGLPVQSFVFGTIGRLAPTKGHEYLIDAFAKVRQSLQNADLLLVGTGKKRAELEDSAERLGCRQSVHFTGWRTDIHRVMRAMDCFVLSSVAEGVGRVNLEAMASRVPVVATAVGGVTEIITHRETGLLVAPKNSQALAEAMTMVAAMPEEELEGILGNAQNRVRQLYSHEVVAKKLAEIYESEFKAIKAQ